MMVRWLVLLVIAAGCATGARGDGTSGDGPPDARPGSPIDARPGSGVDGEPGGATDAPTDSAGGGGGGGGLDPDLSLPDPGGQVCDEPGRISAPECPAGEVCRYFTPTEGRCEGCSGCGGLGASCTATDQCDILFECYQGQCTGFCTLGTTECGAPADCINIGHATRGVCRP